MVKKNKRTLAHEDDDTSSIDNSSLSREAHINYCEARRQRNKDSARRSRAKVDELIGQIAAATDYEHPYDPKYRRGALQHALTTCEGYKREIARLTTALGERSGTEAPPKMVLPTAPSFTALKPSARVGGFLPSFFPPAVSSKPVSSVPTTTKDPELMLDPFDNLFDGPFDDALFGGVDKWLGNARS